MRVLWKILFTFVALLPPLTGYSQQPYWIQSADFSSGSIHTLATDRQGHVFAGTDLGGTYRSTDAGGTWTQINNGMTTLHVRALGADSVGTIFVGTQGGGVFRSTNSGELWIATAVPAMWTVRTLAAHINGTVLTGTSGGGVFRSSDHGASWSQANTGLVDPYIRSFAFDPAQTVYAGTAFAGVFRSNDNGITWQPTGLQRDDDFRALVAVPGPFVFAGGWGTGVFRSSDEGATWVVCNNGLTNLVIESLARGRGNTLIAATRGGVFMSMDWAEHWIPASTGLVDLDVRTVLADRRGFVYAGTASNGVFRSRVEMTTVSTNLSLPSTIQLRQNYPNPFNPATKIQYRLPFGSDVKLSVYNMLGQEVATPVNGYRTAGSYEADFAGTNLASGVYYYTLKAGRFSETKKMILAK